MQHRPTKRAQAALEFLSTYGAAFLIMLVALGALSYTGMFNISSLRSDECTLVPGIECVDFVIQSTQATPTVPRLNLHPGQAPAAAVPMLVLQPINGFGVNLTMVNITMTLRQAPGVNSSCSFNPASGNPSPHWERGVQATIWCPLQPAFQGANYRTNERLDAVVSFRFTQQGGAYQYFVQGKVSSATQ